MEYSLNIEIFGCRLGRLQLIRIRNKKTIIYHPASSHAGIRRNFRKSPGPGPSPTILSFHLVRRWIRWVFD